ncbi:MAG: peptide chain release factor N(5)-glutamine methyltransferase, partial [Verrucomicrobia bacterium]|nr:peptide chain release factor N(5)-glutamine methyltransferase [Verrucomicrobiota bacterium]
TLHHPAIIHEALRQATAFLEEHGIEESRLTGEWLLSHELGCARLELALRHQEPLSPLSNRTFQHRINRAAMGEPVQYILGTAEFMGHAFRVDRRCLIPRPETERLAEWVLGFDPLWNAGDPALADVGTGSGCLAISLALARSKGHYLATDTSAAALALARENAARHGVSARIRFIACDLLSAATPASLAAVVSNPPYIRTTDWARLDRNVRNFEPCAALVGGPDGLTIIRRLMTQALQALKPGGVFFLEIGADQGAAVLELAQAAGFRESQLRPDLAGKDRMVRAVK